MVTFPYPVADLRGGAGDARPPRVQILSISCSFWEILAKSYVGAPPPPGELAPPPRGNPGSATGTIWFPIVIVSTYSLNSQCGILVCVPHVTVGKKPTMKPLETESLDFKRIKVKINSLWHYVK